MVAAASSRAGAFLALVALLAGCFSGNDGTGPSSTSSQLPSTTTLLPSQTTTSGSPTTTTLRPDTIDPFAGALRSELAPQLDNGPNGVPGLASCFAVAYVTTIGPEELAAAGFTPETIDMASIERMVEEMSALEQTELNLATTSCGLMYTAKVLRDLGISEESIDCFVLTYGLYIENLGTRALEAQSLPLWLYDEVAFDAAVSDIYTSCLEPDELSELKRPPLDILDT